ncbi:MAG: Maf family protein [Lachnospiraceae bacterium]|nr:Maf family protein [Lachnospiraceae bacterium]
MNISYKIVLASGSPRRKEILEKLGLEFDIWPSKKEEAPVNTDPAKVCEELASQKALDVASQIRQYEADHPDLTSPQDILVIGADTIVYDPAVLPGPSSEAAESASRPGILGKPADEEDAFRMLRSLSGKSHRVYTGVCFVFLSEDGRAGEYTFHEMTEVSFYPVSDEEIREYIASGEPMDKAGAYGIQGSFLKHIEKISGDYYNVMGLPAARMYQELKSLL